MVGINWGKNQTATAIKYLINPDKSIPAERVFSTKKIHQLGPKTANMIIVFINSTRPENLHSTIMNLEFFPLPSNVHRVSL